MKKTETIQMRLSRYSKENIRQWAKRINMPLTQLYQTLAFQSGPKEVVRVISSEYALRLLSRLGLPLEAISILQNDKNCVDPFAFLIVMSARAELAEDLGDIEFSAFHKQQLEQAESALLRAYGKAMKIKEMEIAN